jgi:hypothetical protein
MHAVGVSDRRLDDVTVGTRHPQRIAAVLIGKPTVVLANGSHRSHLHLR